MVSVAESELEHEREDRGNHLILIHCAAVGRERAPAYARLVAKVGSELARLLVVRADRLSRPARFVFAVDADEEEHEEADDGADDEADRAAVADGRPADPDEEPEEEGPRERDDAVVESGGAEMHRPRSYLGQNARQ